MNQMQAKKEAEADRQAVLADPRYGADETQRALRLKRSKLIAMAFSVACVVLALWIPATPGRYQLHLAAAAGALLAGAGMVRASDGLLVWSAVGKARPSAIASALPLVVLCATAIQIHLIDQAVLIWTATAAGLLAAGLWGARSGARDWSALVCIVLFGPMAFYGIATVIDVGFAPSTDRVFPLRVLGKYVSEGRSRSYHFRLSPWADQPANSVTVPYEEYAKLGVGDAACIHRHPGALGLEWFDIKDCAAGTPLPPPLPPSQIPHDFDLNTQIAEGVAGQAIVRCVVLKDDTIGGCRAVSESPVGVGVGAEAVDRVTDPSTKFKPANLKGHSVIDTLVTIRPIKTSSKPAISSSTPHLPDAPATDFYPPRAQRLNKEGRALVQCNVGEDMIATDCKVISEDPPGFGFGDAAVKMLAHRAKMDPAKLKDSRIVSIPVAFKLAK